MAYSLLLLAPWVLIKFTVVGLVGAIVLLVIYIAGQSVRAYWAAHDLRQLYGPPSDSLLKGNLGTVLSSPADKFQKDWNELYGSTFRYAGFFGRPQLFTTDLKAIAHIYAHAETFDRAAQSRRLFRTLTGTSLLAVDGADHRRMKRVMAPAFGSQAVKEMLPIFYAKASTLVAKLERLAAGAGAAGSVELDVSPLVSQTTMDIIGKAGFGLDLNALQEGNEHELLCAWNRLTEGKRVRNLVNILSFLGVPHTEYLVWSKQARQTLEASNSLFRIVGDLVRQRKAEIAAESEGEIRKSDLVGHDLMTTMLRANMANDLREEQRMSDTEVVSQVPLFLLAGNITMSSIITWSLIMLAQHPDIQRRLREELNAVVSEPDLDTLNGLPYLGAFVQEILTTQSPNGLQLREVYADATIPLGDPVRGRNGRMLDSLHLTKGTTILVPTVLINTSPEIWGPDAAMFNPERHLDPHTAGMGEKMVRTPGLWGNIMTFGGGNRSCIGYRMALLELKAVLFTVVRTCEVSETTARPEFERGTGPGINEARAKDKSIKGVPLVIRVLS